MMAKVSLEKKGAVVQSSGGECKRYIDPFDFFFFLLLGLFVYILVYMAVWSLNPFKTQNDRKLAQVYEFLELVYRQSAVVDDEGNTTHSIIPCEYKGDTFYIQFTEERGTEGYHRCYVSFDDEPLISGEYKRNQHMIKLFYNPELSSDSIGIKYFSKQEITNRGLRVGNFFRYYDGRNPFMAGWTDWSKLINAVESAALAVDQNYI